MYLSKEQGGRLLLQVYVQPKSSRNALVGIHDGALKLAVTSPPVDGKANKAVTDYLAKALGLARRDVCLQSGHTSRRKVVAISGTTMEELREHIESILSS